MAAPVRRIQYITKSSTRKQHPRVPHSPFASPKISSSRTAHRATTRVAAENHTCGEYVTARQATVRPISDADLPHVHRLTPASDMRGLCALAPTGGSPIALRRDGVRDRRGFDGRHKNKRRPITKTAPQMRGLRTARGLLPGNKLKLNRNEPTEKQAPLAINTNATSRTIFLAPYALLLV